MTELEDADEGRAPICPWRTRCGATTRAQSRQHPGGHRSSFALGQHDDDLTPPNPPTAREHVSVVPNPQPTGAIGVGRPVSAAGREMSPTLTGSDVELHKRDREQTMWLFGGCLYRLGQRRGECYESQWPVHRWECERLNHPVVSGVVPWPVDWGKDMPAFDRQQLPSPDTAGPITRFGLRHRVRGANQLPAESRSSPGLFRSLSSG